MKVWTLEFWDGKVHAIWNIYASEELAKEVGDEDPMDLFEDYDGNGLEWTKGGDYDWKGEPADAEGLGPCYYVDERSVIGSKEEECTT